MEAFFSLGCGLVLKSMAELEALVELGGWDGCCVWSLDRRLGRGGSGSEGRYNLQAQRQKSKTINPAMGTANARLTNFYRQRYEIS
jgi:hypothetical protein